MFNDANLSQNYWHSRWINKKTGWDLGHVSFPLKKYINQLHDKDIKILIPGGGNGYEAAYLYNNGFSNIYLNDIAELPLSRFKEQFPHFPAQQLLLDDFFNLEPSYDLILEQTFFCALHPSYRNDYIDKVYELLKQGGKLTGLLFDFPLTEDGPPFGGSYEEYQNLLQSSFNLRILEKCYNSEPGRQGMEYFFQAVKS